MHVRSKRDTLVTTLMPEAFMSTFRGSLSSRGVGRSRASCGIVEESRWACRRVLQSVEGWSEAFLAKVRGASKYCECAKVDLSRTLHVEVSSERHPTRECLIPRFAPAFVRRIGYIHDCFLSPQTSSASSRSPLVFARRVQSCHEDRSLRPP